RLRLAGRSCGAPCRAHNALRNNQDRARWLAANARSRAGFLAPQARIFQARTALPCIWDFPPPRLEDARAPRRACFLYARSARAGNSRPGPWESWLIPAETLA